ncbi:YadA-like family protein [Citrobacter amalonaticus]|uniref:YadA-like family protein n=1 Tax=Citrobacter amalonaticus TaxID=35703 RepID=UPI0018ABA520|nr:YadA-like family protein [Citrobacter amalonaticus]
MISINKSVVAVMTCGAVIAGSINVAHAFDFATDVSGSTQWAQNIQGQVDGLSSDAATLYQESATNNTRITALENAPKPQDGAKGDKGDKGDTGATTTITKKEVDTATISKVKTLSTQTATQSADLNAAKSFFNTQTQHANERMSNIEDRQNSDRKEYRAGIAGAASIAGLHYVDTDNAVAIGAANFKDQQGYALGYRHKFAENVAATLSTSGTSDGDEIVAASASVGW